MTDEVWEPRKVFKSCKEEFGRRLERETCAAKKCQEVATDFDKYVETRKTRSQRWLCGDGDSQEED